MTSKLTIRRPDEEHVPTSTHAAVPEGWVSVEERLPEERSEPYQVIVVCIKPMEGQYAGKGCRRFLQDWVVRRWPQNFTHWMYAMDWPTTTPPEAK